MFRLNLKMAIKFETANERWKWYLSGRLFDQDAPYQDAPNYETQQVRTEMNNNNNNSIQDAWGVVRKGMGADGAGPQRLAEYVIGKWLGPYNNKILQDFYDNSGFIDERKIDWNYIFDDMQKTYANSGFMDPTLVGEQWKTRFDNLEFDESKHRWRVHDLRNKEQSKEKKFFDHLGM